MSVKNNTAVREPTRYCYQHPNGDRVMIYNGVKRFDKGSVHGWSVIYKRVTMLFYDRDYDGNWRASLQEAEAHLMSVYSHGRTFGKPNYKQVVVKRPYSKDPTDKIVRIKLTRFTGGYKFFDLDIHMSHNDALLKAYYQAEDFHWEEGVKLGYLKSKPNNNNLIQLQRLERKYGRE